MKSPNLSPDPRSQPSPRVLITGGTSGLGRALALQLAQRGARVAVVSRGGGSPSPENGGIAAIRADVSMKRDIHRIAAEAHAALGGVDVLVNNASALGPVPLRLLADTECEDFEAVLQANVLGPFRLTRALLPGMLLRGEGLVVNITSDAAANAYPRWGSYGASKAALAQLSRVWGEETRRHGVRFVAFDPGDMDTPMHAAAVPDADRAALKDPAEAAKEIVGLVFQGDGS